MKEIIVPGDLVANEPKKLPGCYIEDGKTYAATVCAKNEDSVAPLKGVYVPQVGDVVVGVIDEELFKGYLIELGCAYQGKVSAQDVRDELKKGDILAAKVISVDEVKEAQLVEPRKLWGGEMLDIEPVKVPRVIGRNSSMLKQITEATQTTIFVGRNGLVYIKGGNTALAVQAILRICRESHVPGLTERISKMLSENKVNSNG